MDFSTIDDSTKLKAMAYDQLVIQEQASKIIMAINQRITEIASTPDTKTDTTDEK